MGESPKPPELSAEFGKKEQEIQRFKKEKLKIDEKKANENIIKEENLDKESGRIAKEIEDAKRVLAPEYGDKLTAKLDSIITDAKKELTGRLTAINEGSEKALKKIYDKTLDRLKGFDHDPEVAVLKFFADKKNDIAQIPEMQITSYKSGSGFYKVINGKLAEKGITEGAIKAVQKILGITVDGKVGPQTIMALSKMLNFRSKVEFGNKTITSDDKELDEQGKVVEPKKKKAAKPEKTAPATPKTEQEEPASAPAPEATASPSPTVAEPALAEPPPVEPAPSSPAATDNQKAEAEKTKAEIGRLKQELGKKRTEFIAEKLQEKISKNLTTNKTPPEITDAIKKKITEAKFDQSIAAIIAKAESSLDILDIAEKSEDPDTIISLLGEAESAISSLTVESFLQTPEVKALTGRLEKPMKEINELMAKIPDREHFGLDILAAKNEIIQAALAFIKNDKTKFDISILEKKFLEAIEKEKKAEWIEYDSDEWKKFASSYPGVLGRIPRFAEDSREFQKKINNFTGIIFFTSRWCSVCQKVKPFLKQLADEKPGLNLQAASADSVGNFTIDRKFYDTSEVPKLYYFEKGKVKKIINPAALSILPAQSQKEDDWYDKTRVMNGLRSGV